MLIRRSPAVDVFVRLLIRSSAGDMLTAAFMIFAAICSGLAQEYRGTITGTITDPSGAVLPNVEVRLTSRATNNTFRVKSTDTGVYTFTLLEPGHYAVHAEAKGFKAVELPDVQVHTAEAVGLNLKMQLGNVSQTVEVTDQTPLLDTERADAGQIIDNTGIEALPMLGRSPFILARISPGVLLAGQITDTEPYNVGGQSFVSIGGGRRYNTEFQIDGVPDVLPVGYFSGRVAYTPPADGTQEFQVITNPFDAQYGSSGAGIISVTTKSGTNNFHGSLYEFFENDKLNATNFFVNSSGGTKPPYRYNQFGGSFGGPVEVPKLINGKDKLFFFFAYEGIRNAAPGATITTVPTQQMRNGDFSQLLSRGIQLYDPFSASAGPKGSYVRAPIPGNIIPATELSPVVKNLLNFIPLPNLAGAGLENNYFSSAGTYETYNNFLGRMDYTISDKQRVFFSIGQYNSINQLADVFHSLATEGSTQNPMQILNFNDTYSWSPTFLMDIRLGYTGWAGDTVPKSLGMSLTQLGFPQGFVNQISESEFPRFDFAYFGGFGFGTNSNNTAPNHSTEHDHTYFTSASFTKIRGSHTIRFGFEGRKKQDYSWSHGNPSGSYVFSGQYTAGPSINAGPGFGSDFASFMYGLPNSGQVDLNAPAGMWGNYFAWFVQDDWKVTRNLTLNLGLRYDLESPTYEMHNRVLAGWLWNQPNPIQGAAQANYAKHPDPALPASQFQVPGGDLFAGVNGVPSGIWDWNYGNVAPRLGLAWNPDVLNKKLSFRAGWGITYFSLSPSGTGTWQYGFSQTTSLVPTANSGVTFLSSLSNPYPNGVIQPVGSSLGPLTYLGLNNDAITRKQLQPHNNHWEAAIQYQLSQNDLLEANYNGSVVVHTPGTTYPLNYVPPQFDSQSPTRDTATINYLTAAVPNPFYGIIPASTLLGQPTITRAQLLMPYPEFQAPVYRRGDNSGSITNEEVYFAWQHRTSHGFTVMTNYLIAKQLWARDKMNPWDAGFDRRPGSEDRPQQFTFTASYDLPFGKGRMFASNAKGVWNALIGGWQTSGIYTAGSGQALSWGAVVFTGNNWEQIMQVPGGQSINGWINTAVFDRNPNDQPNTNYQYRYFPLSVSAARGPGLNTFDFSLNKQIQIRESMALQVRADAFDFLNHPNWGSPNLSPTSSAFGKITSQANLPRTLQLGMRLTF